MAPKPTSPWDTPPTSRVPPDLRSSSTVTTLSSSSRSRSPGSSHELHTTPSAVRPEPPVPPPPDHHHDNHHLHQDDPHQQVIDHSSLSSHAITPARFYVDEFAEDSQLDHTIPNQPLSCRTLPRCAVVNFQKDGDNLCWAPRVTHNASGVAARVHNFEDAFSLEEFSSTALPVVWQSTGGNPRLSSADREKRADTKQRHSRRPRDRSKLLQSQSPPSSRRAHHVPSSPSPVSRRTNSPPTNQRMSAKGDPSPSPSPSKRFKSVSPQRALVKSESVKRTIALANELRRPSFWSLLAHTNKYQKAKARARLQADENKRASKTFTKDDDSGSERRDAICRDSIVTTDRKKPWTGLSSTRRTGRSPRNGRPDPDGRRNNSLFKKLVEHMEKRNASKENNVELESEVVEDAHEVVVAQPSVPIIPVVQAATAEDMPSRAGKDGRPVRTRSRWGGWSVSDSGPRVMELISGRRMKSCLHPDGDDENENKPTERTVANVQEDQYLTFITSVV